VAVNIPLRLSALEWSGSLKVAAFRLRENMKGVRMNTTFSISAALMLSMALPAIAQDANAKYPTMAPLEQYLMDRSAEISLAKSAAPESISGNAQVLVLTRHGYETAVKGTNGFACMVQRSWSAGIDDPDFWNPKLRGPICFNAPAARSQVPATIKRTEVVLAGGSKAHVFEVLKAAIETKELPLVEPGAMCYMMSKQGYLSDSDGNWRPHLMFFVAETDPEVWGAGLPGSPIIASKDDPERFTLFLVPVERWSDGTPGPADVH
jgi:hypothetical protein